MLVVILPVRTETTRFPHPILSQVQVIDPPEMIQETSFPQVQSPNMSVNQQSTLIHVIEDSTKIKDPEGNRLIISTKNLVAPTFPCAVINSFKVNIKVTKLVFENN
jgi:hypothetical protein